MHIGQRIQLTTRIEALGHAAYAGDQGTVRGIHSDGLFTVRMDDGRTQFPSREEFTTLPDREPEPEVIDQQMLDAIEQGRRDMRKYLS
jgi:hypothetical protein